MFSLNNFSISTLVLKVYTRICECIYCTCTVQVDVKYSRNCLSNAKKNIKLIRVLKEGFLIDIKSKIGIPLH